MLTIFTRRDVIAYFQILHCSGDYNCLQNATTVYKYFSFVYSFSFRMNCIFFSRFIVCELIYMHRNAHKYKYTYIHIYISHLTLLCTKTFVVAVKIVGFRNVAIYSGRLMQKKLTWG